MHSATNSASAGDNGSKGGVLFTLRRLISSRRRSLPRVAIRLRKPHARASSPPAIAATTTLASSSPTHKTELTSGELAVDTPSTSVTAVPAPPRDPNASESDDDADDDHDDQDGGVVADEASKPTIKQKQPTKKKKKSKSKWVPKLLHQVDDAAPKDRIYAQRKKHRPREDAATSASGTTVCHAMLRVAAYPLAAELLARVFNCLHPLEPARCCGPVNKALSVAVKLYYSTYCEWPRPRAYLAQQLFDLRFLATTVSTSSLLSRVLAWLPTMDRVCASATSRAFRIVADALPLEFNTETQAHQFLRRVAPDRVELRFPQTPAIHCVAIAWSDAVRLLRLMSDGAGDHFVSVREITLQRLRGSPSDELFVALVQSLFSDRISLTLQKLTLSDLKSEDPHFRHLSRLFYDGHFPSLQSLDVSHNLFTSRFMRDWAKSFHEDRFTTLQSLDITAVGMGAEDMTRFFACLRHTPNLRILRVSHNFCPLTSIETLGTILTQQSLTKLQELSCSAISVADHAMAVLVKALSTAGACGALQHLDLSGNDLSAGDQTMRALSHGIAIGSWPCLSVLNLSFTTPSSVGFQLMCRAWSKCCGGSFSSLRHLHFGGNQLQGDAFESLVMAMESGALRSVELLNLSDNRLGALEFELLAACLTDDCCPHLRALFLAGNTAKGDGITRLRRFFHSPVAQKLHTLDLSGNAIPSFSLGFLADELQQSDCQQLQLLNVSRNVDLRSVVRFQQLIRSGKCPSLACLQVGYAQSQTQGYEFVRAVRSRMSVEELRRLKQLKFETRMKQIEQDNVDKAARAAVRCKRQTRVLREMYDHMESQADRALRRRKRVRKSTHLHIHEEIARLKQDQYHVKVRRQLERTLAIPPSA